MGRKLKYYSCVFLNLDDFEGKVDFMRIFGRLVPLHIEIGTGKATFLLNQARANPDIDFLGIERSNKYYRHAVDRIGRWARAKPLRPSSGRAWTGSSPPMAGLTNVRIIRADAASFLAPPASGEARAGMPDDSVDCFHIYFPDPWPKRRHHKRRFLCPANLANLIRCLKTGGIVRIATDHAEYFEQIRKLITDRKKQLEQIEFLPSAGASNGELTGTNYERKYIKDKRQIYTLAARKK
jgi:tRNA (guanine-N7-)-methyltransferase